MALADAIKAEVVARKWPTCTIAALLSTLDKADAKALSSALADPRVTGAAISRALVREGHRVSAETVMRHRNEECRCGR